VRALLWVCGWVGGGADSDKGRRSGGLRGATRAQEGGAAGIALGTPKDGLEVGYDALEGRDVVGKVDILGLALLAHVLEKLHVAARAGHPGTRARKKRTKRPTKSRVCIRAVSCW